VTAGQLNRQLNRTEFASVVNAITAAFGDPTRRDIFLRVSEATDGLTAAQVAEATGLHPNVARHHLDKLVGGGYVEVGSRATSGAGRPAKVYRASHPGVPLDVNVGHDDILITLLGKALSRLGPDEAADLAEEVGVEYGRTMAAQMGNVVDGQRSFRSALHVVADALSAHGFSAHAERHGDELRIVSSHCPFGDVAIEHPVICAVDRGMVKGLLSSLYGETEVELSASMAMGDDSCVTDIHAG
jgi:predicted ArsR family transcriptional regulator